MSKKRKAIPKQIRTLIWETYIGEDIAVAMCFCCGNKKIKITAFHCGHIVAVSNGGNDTIGNLRPICDECNLSMGTRNMLEFVERYGLTKSRFNKITDMVNADNNLDSGDYLTCLDCGTKFKTKQAIDRHRNRKYKCDSKTCANCKSKFKSPTAYKYHINNKVCFKKNKDMSIDFDNLIKNYSGFSEDVLKLALEVKKQELKLKEIALLSKQKVNKVITH